MLIQITNRCYMGCRLYKNFERRFPKEMEMLKK